MLTRTLFLKLAASPGLRTLVERRGWRFAARFIAGIDLDDALAAVRRLNARGISATLSHLGEHTTDEARARSEVKIFEATLSALSHENLRCGLSIKPSQMGLLIDPALAGELIRGVAKCAAESGRFVRVDMEDSHWTDATLALVRSIHADSPNVGVAIQAYLRRSEADVRALNAEGIPVRLCKGAYNEPASEAYPSKRDVDAYYVRLSRILLEEGMSPAFATHDPRMIAAILRKSQERPDAPWEIQMLHGIRRDLQDGLTAEGRRVRVYVPWGSEWYPYFMRRLAERPANVGFILRNLFRR